MGTDHTSVGGGRRDTHYDADLAEQLTQGLGRPYGVPTDWRIEAFEELAKNGRTIVAQRYGHEPLEYMVSFVPYRQQVEDTSVNWHVHRYDGADNRVAEVLTQALGIPFGVPTEEPEALDKLSNSGYTFVTQKLEQASSEYFVSFIPHEPNKNMPHGKRLPTILEEN